MELDAVDAIDVAQRHADELFLAELAGADVWVDPRVFKDLGRRWATDAEHVGQRSFDALLIRNINTKESGHKKVGTREESG